MILFYTDHSSVAACSKQCYIAHGVYGALCGLCGWPLIRSGTDLVCPVCGKFALLRTHVHQLNKQEPDDV